MGWKAEQENEQNHEKYISQNIKKTLGCGKKRINSTLIVWHGGSLLGVWDGEPMGSLYKRENHSVTFNLRVSIRDKSGLRRSLSLRVILYTTQILLLPIAAERFPASDAPEIAFLGRKRGIFFGGFTARQKPDPFKASRIAINDYLCDGHP
ncbi:MAG TPA: hypothetical protein VGF01_10880 [Terracidiphilus sp.]